MLQSIGLQRVGHELVNEQQLHIPFFVSILHPREKATVP